MNLHSPPHRNCSKTIFIPTNMRQSLSFTASPNTATGLPAIHKQQLFTIHSSKRGSGHVQQTGLQKEAKKELSKILRTDFAIKNIENKVNSKKYKNLWPKAVLEALDEAIRGKKWALALKVCTLLIFH